MARAVLVLVTVGVTIYAIVDCLRNHSSAMRWLPKPVWVVVCALFPPVGALAYLVLGRADPSSGQATSVARRRRMVAPDDDADFLRSLKPNRQQGPEETPREGDESGDR